MQPSAITFRGSFNDPEIKGIKRIKLVHRGIFYTFFFSTYVSKNSGGHIPKLLTGFMWRVYFLYFLYVPNFYNKNNMWSLKNNVNEQTKQK